MFKNLDEYTKQNDFLICVDSDGCAMDTMDVKHIRCFGPCMVEEWELQEFKEPILKRWNDINLYTMTRGINRFKGLALALSEINEAYKKIEGIEKLVFWAENADELSNASLKRELEKSPDTVIFKKALAWSEAVNRSINLLDEEVKLPFEGAKEALEFAHRRADVAIVSSANLDAVLEEWEKYGLLQHVDIVLAQNCGSKAYCISELLKKGYKKENTLMCGDAPGDRDAADKNGVFYYPILVKRERESWDEFISLGFDKLLSGSYGGEYQDSKTEEFLKNLGN